MEVYQGTLGDGNTSLDDDGWSLDDGCLDGSTRDGVSFDVAGLDALGDTGEAINGSTQELTDNSVGGMVKGTLTGSARGVCGVMCLATSGDGRGACDCGAGDGEVWGDGVTNTLVCMCAGSTEEDQTTTEGGVGDGFIEWGVTLVGGDGEEATTG